MRAQVYDISWEADATLAMAEAGLYNIKRSAKLFLSMIQD